MSIQSVQILAELIKCEEQEVQFLAQKMNDFNVTSDEIDFFNKDINTLLEDVFMIAVENKGFYYVELLNKDIAFALCNSLDSNFYINDVKIENSEELNNELSKINKVVNGLI